MPAAALMLVLIACVALLYWSADRARQLFVLSVREGQVLVLRGALPQPLYEALVDVLSRARVRRATLALAKSGNGVRLTGSGLDEFVLQRARNVVGTFPLQRLVSANWPRGRNLGQRLGIAWLAWRMHQRK